MGGKHKLANRTKNNARPSNSGRSAEFLGSSIPQFVGFSGFKDAAFGFSGTSTDDFDSSIDPNVQVIFKKISKKDSTTKIKGLQELSELIKNSEQDVTKSVLPMWPRFYNNLVTDIDNRVREATHSAHNEIVLKAKRNIAPYLKQLMPPWFTSQYDTYPPAGSAAAQAFKNAFPPNKVQEAIAFCQEDILSYISDNLLVQTAQTLSNTKHVSPEEAEAKYERVLIACLQGYCLYLEKVTIEQLKNNATLNNNIISNSKYWKLSKHKSAHIRAAWFKVLTVICQKGPFLLEGKAAQITSTVFGNLEEKDPTVASSVWEAILLTMSTIHEWWTYVNVEKCFFPKLWKILKQGALGNPTIVYPSLLPLISHLPASVNDNASQFYNTFFENFRLGLKLKSVSTSRSESEAVALSFVECFQYVIMKNQDDITLCKMLIRNHLISTIEWCLMEDQVGYKTIFNKISSLVQYWNHNSQLEALNMYLQFFFENIGEVFRDTLFNLKQINPHDANSISNKQIEFLQSLKHTSKPKKQMKVKFSMESSKVVEHPHCNVIPIIEHEEPYFGKLDMLVFMICDEYIKYIEEKQAKFLIEHLCSLVVDFDSENFFILLNDKMKKTNPNSKLINIYTNLLYKWLKSSELCTKHVVNLTFLLFKYLEDEEKQLILDTFVEIADNDCLSWCICEALAHPFNKDLLIKNWLQNDIVSEFIILIAEKEISGDCPSELSALLKLALTENEDGELFVRKDVISRIINKLINTIDNYIDYAATADTCASLAAYITTIIYTENLLLTYCDNLLLALFRLSCNSSIGSDIISPETVYELNSAWQDTISLLTKCLSKADSLALTSKFAAVVEIEFLKCGLEEEQINHITNTIVSYLRAIYRSIPLSLSDFMELFLERTFFTSSEMNLNNLCTISEYIKGNLSSPYKEITLASKDLEELDIARVFAWTFLKLSVFATELDDNFIEDEEEECDKCNILRVLDDRETLVANIVHNVSLGQTYLETFKNTKFYNTILNYYVLTEIKIKSTIENSDENFKRKLKDIMKEKSLSQAWFWCKAAYILYSDIIPQPLVTIYQGFVENVKDGENLGVLHLTQVFSKNLDYDSVRNRYEGIGDIIVLNCLIHCDEIDVQIAEAFGKVEKLRSENVPRFLYDTGNINWTKLQEIVEVVRLCSSLMKEKFSCLSQRHWDFAVLSLVSWASNCLKNRSSHEKYQFQALLTAVTNLYVNTDNQIRKMKSENIKNNYVNEWNDVLVESIHGDLAQLWLYLAEQLESKQDKVITYLPLIQEFSIVIGNINYELIFKINDTSLPKWTKFLKRSCSLLIHRQPNLQLWGYKMLLVLIPGLVKMDTDAVNMNTPHKKGLIFEQFKEKLVETHEIVNSILIGFKLGEDSCRVETSTDSFTYTFAYLLLWDVLLTLCHHACTELRYQYADWLRNEDLLKNFLNNVFRLMPTDVLHYSEGKSKSVIDKFLKKPDMDVTDSCDSEKIENLVCWLYSSTLKQLPALVRQWWTSLETKIAQVVEKITIIYISQHLCSQELNDVMTYQSKFKNMVIRVMPTAREVIAVYTVDEAQVELVITLPSNYPLGGLDVQCNRQIVGTSHKQWLLQFKKCVLHQNGRIWDGLSLWNNNLDRKFDGVEECYICFAVLHPGTYQLPKLSCQTCKKKFHSACLYKWFRTSYKSSCPICRNLF